ncbi:MAG: BlaI/MecI/CopY family transcriptional regulator [Pirellulales bacterium]
MPRPKHEQPTPAELEVLQVLWERGPATVREVMDALNARRPRAYTSVMSLLNVMTDKRLLKQTSRGRAFLYEARAEREKTLGRIVEDVLGRAFEGSASALVARLLDQASPSTDELDEVRRAIDAYQAQQPRQEKE